MYHCPLSGPFAPANDPKGRQCIITHLDYAPSHRRHPQGMEDWDQATLEAAIKQKHANENKPTDIICKFFLDVSGDAVCGIWDALFLAASETIVP